MPKEILSLIYLIALSFNSFAETKLEGKLEPFLGKPSLEIQASTALPDSPSYLQPVAVSLNYSRVCPKRKLILRHHLQNIFVLIVVNENISPIKFGSTSTTGTRHTHTHTH